MASPTTQQGITNIPESTPFPNALPAIQEVVVPEVEPGIAAAATVVTANRAILIPLRPVTRPVTVDGIMVNIGTDSGNYDVGLYSWDGTTMTRVASAGATTGAGTGKKTIAFTAAVTLQVGVRYYAAIAADNGTVTFMAVTSVILLTPYKATSYPLPTTLATLTLTGAVQPIMALRVLGGTIS